MAKKAGQLAKRIGKKIPVLGLIVSLVFFVEACEAKGFLGATGDAILDAAPCVGWLKLGYELGTGEDIISGTPGGDKPDDNYDVSTLSYTQNTNPFNYKPDSQIAVLANGFYTDCSNILAEFGESSTFVDVGISLEDLDNYPVFIIPSGGLYGLDSLPSFKTKLEQYVSNGGTLIVLSQQHGYEFNAAPGNLSGYGWTEDQSCQHSSVGICTYHPILSGQDSVTSDVNVDGFFTKYPENATVLLSRTKNGMPAMLMYEFGNGTVIATTIYTDWAYRHHQATSDGKYLVNNMAAWAKEPREIPEYAHGDAIDIPVNITSYVGLTAEKVVFTVIDADKNVVGTTNITISISPYEKRTVNFTFTAPSKTGIMHLDYSLVDDDFGEVQCGHDIERFAVSKYAENPEGFVYQGKDIAFTVSSPEEHYAYGSDVPFAIHIWNKGDIDRDILVKTSYEDWSLSSVPLEKVNETITVPANGDAAYTHTVNVGDIRLSHNQLIIRAEFYEDGSNLGRTEKVVWMFSPSVSVHVETDQKEYAKGEDVSVLLNLTNKRSTACNATIKVKALDLDNNKIFENTSNINPSAYESLNKMLSFALPSTSEYGTYVVTAEAYSNGNKIGSGSTYFEVLEAYIAKVNFDKPDKSYKIREDMNIDLEVTNIGSALWESTINISIPDLAFEDSKSVSLTLNETEKFSYNLSIPETTSAGKHDVIVSISFDNSLKQYYFVIPDSNLVLSSEKTSYDAREYLYFNLTNIGGVDTTCNCSIKFYGPRALRIYGNDTHGTILAGGTQTHSYKIPEQAVSGNYYLMVTCKDLNTNKITRLSKSHTISGLKAALTSVTDKIVYSPDENISILTNITNLDGAITNGILNLKIVCPYIQNSASKMPSSNANINRTARLKILEQKDIDIDYNYRDSMMREPHPDRMSMPINELEDFTPPLPEHYNFSFPFELEPPVEEEINESSRPQLFSSASMEIRNETVWKDEVKILNDNLIIYSTGKLTLINTTLIMNCSSDGEYRIEVRNGGEMHILNKSNITAMNPIYAFCFKVRSGSTFEMRDSELHGCGFQSYFLLLNGLWINTNDAIIENNSMTDNYHGIILYQSSNSTIVNNDVSSCDAGIILYRSSNNNLTQNKMNGNIYNFYISGDMDAHYNNSIDTSNTVDGRPIYYVKDEKDQTYEGNINAGFFAAISCDNITVKNLELSNNFVGILFWKTDNSLIQNLTTRSNDKGISLQYSSNNSITGNNASSNSDYGIFLSGSSNNNSITGNNASSNYYYGISLSGSSNNNLTQNKMNGNIYNFYISGDMDAHYNNSIDTSNTVDGRPIYYVKDEKDQTYEGNINAGFFAAISCDNITVKNLELSNNFVGILFWKTDNSLIQNLTTRSNDKGISLQYSSNNSITGNNASLNTYHGISLSGSSNNNSITGNNASSNYYYGISLSGSSNNSITGNNASSNYAGIYLYRSSNNNITGNNASSNYAGIYLYRSSNNNITGNNASSNSNHGIYLYRSSNNNITGNNASSNSNHGIYLSGSSNNSITGNNASSNYDGFSLYSSSYNNITGNNASSNTYHGISLYGSGNNLIYNNYFNNTKNAFDNSNNIWNITTKTPGTNIVGGPWLGGNYWSDYKGTDEDGDGLGDTLLPYNCSGNIIQGGDHLPLITPESIGKTIWETNITIDMAPNETKNIITVVPLDMFNDMTGKVELITTLYSDLGQIIAHEDPFFYITDTNTSLVMETDKRVYKPNETIAIYGEVKNQGSQPESYNLSIKKDGAKIFADAFTLNPDQTHDFALNTSSNTSFTLEGSVDGVVVTDFVSVETASINVSIIAPDVVGINPFNVGVLIENVGRISADLNVSINSMWNITVPEGESRLLEETTMSITKNTTLNVTISGDVDQTYQKEIFCGENARINITPEPTYLEGTVDIPYIIENIGLLDSEFNATFSRDDQTILESFFIPKGQNITDSVSFNLTIGSHLLQCVSPFEVVNTTLNVLSPPEFVVTSIYPADRKFTIGEDVTLVIEVENIGGSEGEAMLSLEMPDFEDTNRTWIRAGAKENISFNLTIPDDLEEKNYKGFYVLDGKREEFTFFVQGANISVDASLDKSMYAEGDTAVLTLELTNECELDLDLYSRVKFNAYDSVQNYTLPGSGTETLVFYVPVNFTGDNKMLYTVYMDSGRSLYINSIYIYEEQPDVPLKLFTDKDVYNMGDVVTIHIVDVTEIDVLNLTAPNFTYKDTVSGPMTLDFTLPELRSGTYYIEYTYGNFSSAHPFDVRGYSARIIEACLDKEVYYSGDIIKLKMNVEANRNVSGLQKTWIYDPENELVDEFAMNKTLMEGENKIEISRTLSTNISGIHVIVYGFSAELSGDSFTMLVSGAEYFDAEAEGLCGDVAPYPDCNGIVDMGDVILLLNNVSYPENPRYALCNDWAGDCRCNGVRDMGDVILLLNNVSYPEDPRYVLNCC
uniref:Uncharacterized protein n=1 Tax=Candidatus Methanophaga sp. ANME-1 ERB7 TaxID=2759913 RepID=A0A7G9Z688_9EURY|nr:hypothetical protein DIJDKDOB_00003 [Methanosarcinales archaeon ANME-1 ERB7]